MSGHSKWSQIKRAKGAADAARGRLFTKIGKEIYLAVRAGGADPDSNAKLREVISKARASNMPNDNIQRCIKKASGEGATKNYEPIVYEGYGAGGVAVIVECLTDNKNRTAGEVRSAFDKHGGSLGVAGSVQFMFERLGVVSVSDADEAAGAVSDDKLLEILIDAPIKDIRDGQILCEVSDLGAVCLALEKAGVCTQSAQAEWVAKTLVEVPKDREASFEKMLGALDECEDVQNVFHNAE